MKRAFCFSSFQTADEITSLMIAPDAYGMDSG